MSNVVASHHFKNYPKAGIVIVKEGNMFAVGNYQTIPGIGPRYVIRGRFTTEAKAREIANRAWSAEHHDVIPAK